MRKTISTKTTLEMREVLILRTRPAAIEPCPDCLPATGLLVSPDAAASMTRTSVRAVFRGLEANLIHYREVEEGKVLVCVNSLFDYVGSPAPGSSIKLQLQDIEG